MTPEAWGPPQMCLYLPISIPSLWLPRHYSKLRSVFEGRYSFWNLGDKGVMSCGKSDALDKWWQDDRGEASTRKPDPIEKEMQKEPEVCDGANEIIRTASTVSQWFLFYHLIPQAPTHLSGALVRPDPGSCVYELANQSQDGKCQIWLCQPWTLV